MYPSYKLIRQIKRAAGGDVSNEGLERSLALLEAETPIGALMSTLAAPEFSKTMLDVARGRPEPEMLAWMAVAAAGPIRVHRALAARAVQIVAPPALVDILIARGEFRESCAAQAEGAPSEEEWGAWLMIGRMRPRDVRAVAQAQPALRRRLQEARRQAKRPINPQLRGQLRALGLV